MHFYHMVSTYHSISDWSLRILSQPANHGMILFTWGTFFVAAAVGLYIDYLAQMRALSMRSFLAFCFPRDGWKSGSARVDAVMYFVGKVTDRVIGAGGVVFTGVVAFYVSKYLDTARPTI
jgi:hypothetical protein